MTPSSTLQAFQILAEQHGYGRSQRDRIPVAADGSPLPWYTYPAIEYFQQVDVRGLRIFEYGSGHSSLFWSRKGAFVWSVEHDKAWFDRMQNMSASLQELLFSDTPTGYASAIDQVGGVFDIVIVDGAWRNQCLASALPRLTDTGVVILDNSDWYTDVASTLRDHGFLQVDFNGFGPINNYCWTTSLFVRAKSFLGARLGHPHPIGGIAVCKSATW